MIVICDVTELLSVKIAKLAGCMQKPATCGTRCPRPVAQAVNLDKRDAPATDLLAR